MSQRAQHLVPIAAFGDDAFSRSVVLQPKPQKETAEIRLNLWTRIGSLINGTKLDRLNGLISAPNGGQMMLHSDIEQTHTY